MHRAWWYVASVVSGAVVMALVVLATGWLSLSPAPEPADAGGSDAPATVEPMFVRWEKSLSTGDIAHCGADPDGERCAGARRAMALRATQLAAEARSAGPQYSGVVTAAEEVVNAGEYWDTMCVGEVSEQQAQLCRTSTKEAIVNGELKLRLALLNAG